jgi:hypothetical protein
LGVITQRFQNQDLQQQSDNEINTRTVTAGLSEHLCKQLTDLKSEDRQMRTIMRPNLANCPIAVHGEAVGQKYLLIELMLLLA